jgi:hypothetical protein
MRDRKDGYFFSKNNVICLNQGAIDVKIFTLLFCNEDRCPLKRIFYESAQGGDRLCFL